MRPLAFQCDPFPRGTLKYPFSISGPCQTMVDVCSPICKKTDSLPFKKTCKSARGGSSLKSAFRTTAEEISSFLSFAEAVGEAGEASDDLVLPEVVVVSRGVHACLEDDKVNQRTSPVSCLLRSALFSGSALRPFCRNQINGRREGTKVRTTSFRPSWVGAPFKVGSSTDSGALSPCLNTVLTKHPPLPTKHPSLPARSRGGPWRGCRGCCGPSRPSILTSEQGAKDK